MTACPDLAGAGMFGVVIWWNADDCYRGADHWKRASVLTPDFRPLH